MSTKVIMPQMGESVVEGKVAKWLVREGDRVETDQPIAEISTDKVDVEIPSPGAGTLTKIYVPEGATVSIGAELAVIGEGKEAEQEAAKPPQVQRPPATTPGRPPEAERPPTAGRPAPSPTAPSPEKPAEKSDRGEEKRDGGRISPLVRKLAEEHQVDLAQVQGTGLGGRITKQDILRYVGEEETQPAERTALTPAAAPREAASQPSAPAPSEAPFKEFKPPRYEPKEGDQIIPFSRLRKMIAEHMVYSKRTAPHVTTVAEVDMVNVVRLREEKKKSMKEQTGHELTYLPFIVAATLQAIREYPILNAAVVDDSLVIRKEIHMGIAVETEKGLMVPVIRRAHEMSLAGLSRAASELAEKARKGALSPDEIAAGSFTISNPGRKGNLFGTPILFQPQVGILRMGEIIKRPIVVEVDGNDSIAIRPMMYLALSYDHRVIDGATGNLFLHRVKEILEEGRFQL